YTQTSQGCSFTPHDHYTHAPFYEVSSQVYPSHPYLSQFIHISTSPDSAPLTTTHLPPFTRCDLDSTLTIPIRPSSSILPTSPDSALVATIHHMASFLPHCVTPTTQSGVDVFYMQTVGFGYITTHVELDSSACVFILTPPLHTSCWEAPRRNPGEKGDAVVGDWLCFLSWNKPIWFAVRESGIRERETRVLESENGLIEILGSGVEFDGVDVDVLDIDPIKDLFQSTCERLVKLKLSSFWVDLDKVVFL
ncbi:mitotic apparatus protein p62, partial [Fagus crenata]